MFLYIADETDRDRNTGSWDLEALAGASLVWGAQTY
jgi:hypothetical protein